MTNVNFLKKHMLHSWQISQTKSWVNFKDIFKIFPNIVKYMVLRTFALKEELKKKMLLTWERVECKSNNCIYLILKYQMKKLYNLILSTFFWLPYIPANRLHFFYKKFHKILRVQLRVLKITYNKTNIE